MKKILAFCCLMVASVCWGQGTYTTTFSKWPAVTDATAYLGGATSFWKPMASKPITAVTYALWGDIYVISGGCVFTYNPETRVYTQVALGCGWSEIGTRLATGSLVKYIELLKPDTGCPSGTQRRYFSQDLGAAVNTGICVNHWRSGYDNGQLEVNMNGGGISYFWNGTGLVNLGTGWIDGSVQDTKNACAFKWDTVTAGNVTNVYVTSPTGTMMKLPVQPPQTVSKGFLGGFTGCAINEDIVMVTDGTKSYMYDRGKIPTPTTWQVVTGAVSGITGTQKATMFGIVSGNLRHLNVYAAFISATLSGTFNGCPTDTSPCPPSGVNHTKSVQVKFPHGVNGALATFVGAPGATNTVTSWDASGQCDLLFGAVNDLECFAPTGGGVLCSFSGVQIYPVPPPPMCHDNKCTAPNQQAASHDARSYTGDGFATVTASAEEIVNGTIYAVAYAKCEADVPACAPGTPPAPLVCPATSGIAPGGHPFFGEQTSCEEVAPYTHCGKVLMGQRAVNQCKNYLHGYGFIEFIAGYDPNDPAGPLCYPLPIVKHFAPPVNYPCHEELH